MSTDLVTDIVKQVAQQNAMERRFKFLPHGSRLFEIEQGWESKAVSNDETVSVVDTVLKLETALKDTENKVIFIPIGAMITEVDIEKLCQRTGVMKTLFKEVQKS